MKARMLYFYIYFTIVMNFYRHRSFVLRILIVLLSVFKICFPVTVPSFLLILLVAGLNRVVLLLVIVFLFYTIHVEQM